MARGGRNKLEMWNTELILNSFQHVLSQICSYKAANQRAIEALEKFGATLMEVDADGSLSFPDPQINSKDNVWNLILLFMHLTDQLKAYVNDMELVTIFPSLSLMLHLVINGAYFQELFHENTEMLQMLKETAMSEVDNIMLTDAPLLFPPGQLALAALCRSNQGHGAIDFDRHLDSILSRQKSAHTIYELFERINSIESWVNRYAFPSEKDLKHINRRLKSCWGLGSNDESEKGRRNQSTNQRRVRMKRKIYLRTISCTLILATFASADSRLLSIR
ncbi:cyclin-H1-1-like isoform X1 [Cucurbita moschata]|uniref:Cyclin-H1-1-like isoform X1 n=1 Tax=Cucurbita moschata TaxID=3662 RepID=A0A6J1GGL2_CUCMO|nr:cyclin-H1-1-like isoform X1 [Cucurbita moschata]